MVLMAAKAGVHVSDVVISTSGGRDDLALLALLDPVGRPLSDLDPDEVTDAVLDDAWRSLARLHDGGARPRPGRARQHPASPPTARPACSTSPAARPPHHPNGACATASICSPRRLPSSATTEPLRSALRALGDDGLAELLPLLQTAALSPAARRAVHRPPQAS